MLGPGELLHAFRKETSRWEVSLTLTQVKKKGGIWSFQKVEVEYTLSTCCFAFWISLSLFTGPFICLLYSKQANVRTAFS